MPRINSALQAHACRAISGCLWSGGKTISLQFSPMIACMIAVGGNQQAGARLHPD